MLAAVDEKGQEEEEEKGEECPLRLHSIESNNADNLAGPPLIYGHRYHTFCLWF